MNRGRVMKNRIAKIFCIFVALGYPAVTHRTWKSDPLPAQYNVISNYGRQYIFRTGTLPPEVSGPTFIGDLRDNALHDSMNVILSAVVNIVTGTTGIRESQQLHQLFPWHYLILVPLSIYVFAMVYRRISNSEFTHIDAAILFAFVLFPLATRPRVAFRGLNSRSAAAIGLFHFLIVLILLDATGHRKYSKRRIGVYLILLTAYFPLHHTWSYYLLIVAGSLGVLGLLRGNRFLSRILVSVIILWSVNATYYVQNQIAEPIRLFAEFETRVAALDTLFQPAPVTRVDPSYLYSTSYAIDQLRFVNALLVVSIFVIFGGILVYRLYHDTTGYIDFEFGSIYAGLTVTAVGLFVWQGFSGVRARILQISIPLSRILLGYLLVSVSSKRVKWGVRTVAIAAACLCVLTLAFFPPGLSYQISPAEGQAIETVGTFTPSEQSIYGDYRLAPPLLLFGQTSIYTFDARDQSATKTEEFLDQVYYNPTAPQESLDELISDSNYTVLLTERQTEIAILDVGLNRFRPVNASQIDQWNRAQQFNRVYSNGETYAYARHPAE